MILRPTSEFRSSHNSLQNKEKVRGWRTQKEVISLRGRSSMRHQTTPTGRGPGGWCPSIIYRAVTYTRCHIPSMVTSEGLQQMFYKYLSKTIEISILKAYRSQSELSGRWQQFLGIAFSSVLFSRSVVPNSLQPHGPQHARPPVHHQLLESTQTHVHWVGDAIQPSYPLLSPSPPAFNLPQHQSLYKWVSSLYQVAKVLEFQLQHQSLQWTARTDLL